MFDSILAMNNYFDMNDVEQLIIDKLTGQIGEEDDLRLSALITRHQEVEQLWQQMQQIFAMRKAVNFDQSFNEIKAWQALQLKVNLTDPVYEPVTDSVAIHIRHSNKNWLLYCVAAAVTGVIIIAAFFFINQHRSQVAVARDIQIKLANGKTVYASTQDSLASWMQHARDASIDPGGWNALIVPSGKSYSFQLSDGSKVQINAVSELRFPLMFTQRERNVELTGEAYFKVAHLASQPFTVRVNGLIVKALGTEFNIRSYNRESTYISLVNGSVSVENASGERIILSPGEAVMAENRNSALHKERFDEIAVLGWMKGLYFFRNEDLQQIAVVAERCFNVDVQLKDTSLADLRFSGAMNRNKSLNTFFNMLAASGDIRYQVADRKVIISRN
jgi:transmembrane sensor